MSFAGPSVLPINQSPRFVLFTVFKTFLLRIDFCSSGSSGGGSIRHTLAASGSGSESEVGGNMSNHAANLSISNHPTNHSNLTLSNHPTNMNNFLTEPPTGPPPLPPGGSFMIPQSGMWIQKWENCQMLREDCSFQPKFLSPNLRVEQSYDNSWQLSASPH